MTAACQYAAVVLTAPTRDMALAGGLVTKAAVPTLGHALARLVGRVEAGRSVVILAV